MRLRTISRPRHGLLRIVLAVSITAVFFPGVALAGDTPYGFYYGADGSGPLGGGTGYPYSEPGTGGIYGGYVGEVGTWTNWQGCTNSRQLSTTAIDQVNADEAWAGWGVPIPGVSFYWFAAGPGADPNYNGSYSEAYNWGVLQAQRALWAYQNTVGQVTDSTYPFMFMDIEQYNGSAYNGWNEQTDRCGNFISSYIPYHTDRGTVDGFVNTITGSATPFWGGIYSSPQFWTTVFGTGTDASVPNYYQWTYETSTAHVTPAPVGFSQSGYGSAQWFGGVTSNHQAGWQWNQSGGDWDQWNVSNFP